MKLMIASDIHGSKYYCEKLINSYKAEKADRLLLLGDLLYHGPRNALPREYEPQAVIAMLNSLKNDILAVRGNCEAEVDQMVLEFPCLADYSILEINNKTIFATHGHLYGETTPPPHKNGDILLCGHTHIPAFAEYEDYIYINPGSVSIPKENSNHGYMIFDENGFSLKDFEGKIIMTKKIR